MHAAIISFPGSNREQDAQFALELAGFTCSILPAHSAANFEHTDLILLPGGFSYGDYLRCGAIAANLPIMHDVRKAAKAGRHVMGICNGFQILTESGLLSGALRMNVHQLFLCKTTPLQVVNANSNFSHLYDDDAVLNIPIAHHEGNFLADTETLNELESEGRVIFRYAENPNGSMNDIAGIQNAAGNVFGMMPHPENAALGHHQSKDGLALFTSIAERIGA